MQKSLFLILLSALTLFCTCKKVDPGAPTGITVQGNVTLVVTVSHHWWNVPSIPVYIKFNTTTWPGKDSALYDIASRTDHEGSVMFSHFGPGSFEIYSAGYDSIWGAWTIGYNTWTITKQDANNTVYANVVVSEKF